MKLMIVLERKKGDGNDLGDLLVLAPIQREQEQKKGEKSTINPMNEE